MTLFVILSSLSRLDLNKEYISELPTLKTAHLTSFLLAASTSLQNYQRIHNYYCQDKWSQKLKFKTYINKQKGTQEIAKDSLTTAKSIAKQIQFALKTKTQAKSNMYLCLLLTSLPPLKRRQIIAFGNENANNPTGETEFVSIDEYLKSQICNKWKSKQLNNISATRSKRRVHSVLKCESWNCDANSSLNINGIFVYKSKYDNESPPPFKRPSED
ncbi:hypothetical protein AB4K20DRAFT_1868671 [Rhizopus microsporus]